MKGNFIPGKQVLVDRVQDARMGYLIVKPFKQKNENFTILVNCGWIPHELKQNPPDFLSHKKENFEIVGLLKRDENLEIKRTNKLYPRLDELFNLIDNEQIGNYLEVDYKSAKGGYLELIKDKDRVGGVEEELYPVTPTSGNFCKPYLTPRKHVEYSTFWGLAAGIGFISILKVMRM